MYLEECIQSVLRQGTNDYEIVLVDDGSTDDSAIICDDYSEKNERIKVFHKENEGPIPTRLFGLEQAKGEYIVHLDADDYLENNALQYLKSIFQKYHCDCTIFGFRSFKDDKILNVYTIDNNHLSTDKHEICSRIFSGVEYNALWRKAYKRDIVDHGKLDELYHIHKGEDLLLSLGVVRCCRSIFFTNEVLYNYRINDESIMHKKEPLPRTIEFELSEIVLEFIKQEAGFSEREMDNYRGTRYRESFIPIIKRIVIANSSTSEKVQLLRQIRRTHYYKEFLGKRIIRSKNNYVELLILMLYRYGFDRVLIAILQIAKNTQ